MGVDISTHLPTSAHGRTILKCQEVVLITADAGINERFTLSRVGVERPSLYLGNADTARNWQFARVAGDGTAYTVRHVRSNVTVVVARTDRCRTTRARHRCARRLVRLQVVATRVYCTG
jgi:hypothetical protein